MREGIVMLSASALALCEDSGRCDVDISVGEVCFASVLRQSRLEAGSVS